MHFHYSRVLHATEKHYIALADKLPSVLPEALAALQTQLLSNV
jgi:hypothetical protein